MREILARNPAASALAERLWNFFGCRLMCGTPKEQDTSRIRYGITEYAPELKAVDLMPTVLLGQSDRMEEALVHELLHLELVRLGYPRFYLDHTDRSGLAQGITNCSDHVVMRPLFAALGYSRDRFETRRKLTEEDKHYLQEIEALPNMHSPEGYTISVSACLKKHGFGFRLVHVHA